ncbi:MAG: PKD domain-containing protein [Planctomycetes bacterium]|nr:PKD domain-containing protein [Planctomycetota bacterium]
MPARLVLGLFLATFVLWFNACSKGIGNNRPTTPGGDGTAASSNLPVGIDLGLVPTSPVTNPAVAGIVVPAIGATAQREVVLLGFATAAAANDGDGLGTALSRDTVTDTNGGSDVFVAAISAQSIETRAFSQSLAGKFRHPRCVTCHSMQSPTTTAFQTATEYAFPYHAGPAPGPTFPNNDPATCAPCHVTSTTFPVNGWQAPAVSFDMRTETVAQLADRATRIPAGDLEHFRTDARVLWALDSGILPGVGGRNAVADDDHDGIDEPEDRDGTPRPVPGGSARFLAEIEDWIASGRVVSCADAVRDVTLVSRASSGTAASNGASGKPQLVWVPNGSFNPTSAVTAAATNPIGTLLVVFESTGSDLTAGDANGASDVYRVTLQLRAEENAQGVPTAGGLNLAYVASNVLVSARNGLSTAGDGASSNPRIGGSTGDVVAFQSAASNLVGAFVDGNGTGTDVYVRRIGTTTTLLVSHQTGGTGSGGNGTSVNPAIDATGVAVAFESDASDLIASDTNAVRDVFFARVDGASPFAKTRASVTDAGAEGTGGACGAASIQLDGSDALVAFESTKTNLETGLVAASNVFLFDASTGFTTLLNQRVSAVGTVIGDGSARAPWISASGDTIAFESEAANIDVLRSGDLNHAADVFLVEVPPIANGSVLPFRVSMTATSGASANGASTAPMLGSFTGTASAEYPVGFVAYATTATNLGTSDSTTLVLSFLSETSGVFADFDVDVTRGAIPLTVQFTDTSTGNPTAWQWDFDNDGNVDSTVQNPTYTYTTAGTYSVRLVASNALTQGSTTQASLVTAVTTPDADFTASVTSGVAPLSVTFTDTSTQSPTSWAWDFQNDGTVDSTVQNPTFVFSTPGVYEVELTVTNESGSNTETKTSFVEAFTPVVASFTRSPSSGTVPFVVTFTNTSTGATSYSWDFGDGGSSTSTSPTHNYTVGGSYTVTLTATGPGGVDTETASVTANSPVTAGFTVSGGGGTNNLSAYESTSLTFTNTSTGATSYAWDFDFVGNPGTLTSTSTSPSRNFANTTSTTRSFVVRLVATGPGGSSSTTRTLTIVSDTESATFNPSADTTIYEESTGNSNGANTRMIAGKTLGTAGALSRRALLRFDLSSITSSSTINSAALTLTHDTPLLNGSQSFGIHRVTQSWVEGTANGSAGGGTATAGGGATWSNRTTGVSWSSAGGTFNAATTTISVPQAAGNATSGSLTTDVQAWVNGTANNGWLLQGNEGATQTVKRFLTNESISPPSLAVNWTRPLP